MYLTAQRVVSRREKEGINAFLYLHHGPLPGRLNEIPGKNSGQLERKRLSSVKPPGNRVRSYIDIVSPDEMLPVDLAREFIAFIRRVPHLPCEAIQGPCFFRIEMDAALAKDWMKEVAFLAGAAGALLLDL